MKSALGQKASFKFNVIVVNNHSTDRTGELLDELKVDNLIQIVPERSEERRVGKDVYKRQWLGQVP